MQAAAVVLALVVDPAFDAHAKVGLDGVVEEGLVVVRNASAVARGNVLVGKPLLDHAAAPSRVNKADGRLGTKAGTERLPKIIARRGEVIKVHLSVRWHGLVAKATSSVLDGHPGLVLVHVACKTCDPQGWPFAALDSCNGGVAIVRVLDRERHVALARAVPDVAERDVLDGDGTGAASLAGSRDGVGPARCSGLEECLPRARGGVDHGWDGVRRRVEL